MTEMQEGLKLPEFWMENSKNGDVFVMRASVGQIMMVDETVAELWVAIHEDGPGDGQWWFAYDTTDDCVVISQAGLAPGGEELSDPVEIRRVSRAVWSKNAAATIADLFIDRAYPPMIAKKLQLS